MAPMGTHHHLWIPWAPMASCGHRSHVSSITSVIDRMGRHRVWWGGASGSGRVEWGEVRLPPRGDKPLRGDNSLADDDHNDDDNDDDIDDDEDDDGDG